MSTVRVCKHCGETKDITLFKRDYSTSREEYRFVCKACLAIQSRAYNLKYRNKAEKREQMRRYDRTRKRKQDPVKQRARWILRYYVKTGAIVRPVDCSACGAFSDVHAHHEDYSKPLEVEWLCETCHKLKHRKYAVRTA